MKIKCVEDLKKGLAESFPQAELPADWEITPEICPSEMDGDLTVNCFRFARIFKTSPDKVADAAFEFLNSHDDVEKAEKIKAFVNLTLKPGAVHRDCVADVQALMDDALLPEDTKQRILIEYSAPNTNKPQHLGHVRNNTLGMALASLLSRVGNDVKPVNLVNDRGIHICKSMIAYQRFGDGMTPESTGIKGDHLVGNFYVKYNEELAKQLGEYRTANPGIEGNDDELFLNTEIGQATQKMLQDWEANDLGVRELWEKMNGWVFKGFDETYARMGVEFKHTYLESDTYLLGKDLVDEALEKGVFKKRDDGAVIVDLGKMGEKVVLRSDGTSVYITQDMGTSVKKHDDFDPEVQIWVVGDEQILHFKQLFAILEKMGYEWASNLYHLAYGMVNLPSGKMKSREGKVVDADDLFDEMVGLVKSLIIERCEERGEEIPEDVNERSEIIGMGALKFMLLKFNPKTTIKFDPEASVKFEGDTGPYIQYACARINSIERKALEAGITVERSAIDWDLLSTEEEKSLAICASFYGNTLKLAADKMDCSVIVNYLLDLAKAFSRFYRECPVLNADNEALKKARLALSYSVRDVLVDGLKTLTIDVPKAM